MADEELVDVHLIKAHTHAGVTYPPGTVISVPADSAARLEEWGAGKRVPLVGRGKPAAPTPKTDEGS